MSVIALVAWDQAPRWGKRQKTGSNTQIISPLTSLADVFPFFPQCGAWSQTKLWLVTFLRLKFPSRRKRTKGFEGWAAGKFGKIRYQLFLHNEIVVGV